jgi:hypothetical protein
VTKKTVVDDSIVAATIANSLKIIVAARIYNYLTLFIMRNYNKIRRIWPLIMVPSWQDILPVWFVSVILLVKLDSAKAAFEQIQLRLNTMTELGDVVVTLSPAMNAIKGIQGGLSSMMPQADQSFGQISDLLGNIMTDSNQTPTAGLDSSSIRLDEEAIDILQEATSQVEANTRDKIPDLSFSKDRLVSSSKTASSVGF